MNAERLLACYERISDAPDAIPRLRRFALDLAVRGKLVSQDPSDKPSPELQKRITGAKENIDQSGLPSQWRRTKVGTVLDFQYGKGLEVSERAQGPIPVFGSNGIVGFTSNPLTVRPSIIVGRKGSAGALNLCNAPSWTTDVAYFVEAPTFLDLRFLFYVLTALDLDKLGKGVKPGLSRSDAYQKFLNIPPPAEQLRIVSMIDELMALCDQLDVARTKQEAMREKLTTATFARLGAADPETFSSDLNFALDTLPALTARADQIKQLRQTILNLAVRGKLVRQDPNDERATELLNRIAKGKAERKKKTDDARIKMERDPDPAALQMTLPQGWAVQSFENLFLFIDYRGKTPPKTNEGIPLITAKNIRMGYLNREPREYVSDATYRTWMTRGFPELGDLFFTTEAPLANICLNDVDERFALAQRIICFQPYGKIDMKFLMFAIMSDVMQSLIDAHATGLTAKGIKAAKLKPLPIPIPPLAEQHRIVDKVDELMAVCDQLEINLAFAADTRYTLLTAVLADALASERKRELEAAE